MDYRVISTDDHLQEAPDTWTNRMSSAKWGDKLPQIRKNDTGTESWFIYGEKKKGMRGVASVNGAMPDRTKDPQRWSEVPAISYVPAQRIKAMQQDGVDVHTFFGNIAGIAGNTFSDPRYPDDYRLEAIQAFNNYQIDEWAIPYPGRFITLAILPMWDVQKAVAELVRMDKRGVKGCSFAFPQMFGLPHIADPHWDPLWATAQAADLSVNFHIGSGRDMGIQQSVWSGHTSMGNLAERSVKAISSNTEVMSTLLFSGIMERFPRLKIVSSESGLGWVPYLLEVADHQWERQKLWQDSRPFPIKPSDYFHRQCYVNFWFEVIGIKLREYIGIDNILWESDFPHPTCTWPTSQAYIERGLAEVPEAERRKVLVENAVRVFHL